MTNTFRLLSSVFVASALALPAMGQTDDTFDLSSQRSEKQTVSSVPGHYVADRPFVGYDNRRIERIDQVCA